MSKHVTTMTIYDVEHYSDAEKKMIVDGYAEHERDARSKGVPTQGSGVIFPVDESAIVVPPFEIPFYWPRICGIDFGWDHPAAAAWLALDPDTDTIYLTDCYKAKKTLIPILASAIKSRGNWIPVAWPHDGNQVKDAMHGQQISKQYKSEGVNMLKTHAHFKKDVYRENQKSIVSVEPGIQDMLTRMSTGKWKVFSTCGEWLEEFRMYHRKDGIIVKLYDDLMDASRYALMMIRHAKILESKIPKMKTQWRASDPGMGY